MLRKLMIIIMGIFLVICAGSNNLYPLYLKAMMDKFNFTLKEVNLYGAFINIGTWVGFPMGWIYDSFGPKISCIVGAFFLGGSYYSLHFIFNSDLSSVPLVVFLLIAIIMGQGNALCLTTSISTNLKNFRFKETSAIVGLLMANLALSPSVLTSYRQALVDVNIPTFFLIIAFFIVIITALSTFVFHNIRRVYNEDEQQKTYEKYKEKKLIKFLIYLNILILTVYTFGIIFHSIWESENEVTKFPLVIIYPCLQMLNFLVVIIDWLGFFDKIYFKPFIDKMILKQINKKEDDEKENNSKNINVEKLDREMEILPKSLELATNVIKDDHIKDSEQIEKFSLDKDENQPDNNFNNVKLGISSNKSEDKLKGCDSNSVINPNQEKLNSLDENKNTSFRDAIKSPKVIILFIMMILGVGSEIANLNNIEFIIIAITQTGPSNSTVSNNTNINLNTTLSISTNTSSYTSYPIKNNQNSNSNSNLIYSYVILYFVFNSFTRIISGMILDHLIKKGKFFYYLTLVTGFGLLSQFFGIFMNKHLLLLSMSLAGACHGGYMTFLPVFVRNEFGLTHLGKILGFLTTGNAIGALVIADGIFIIFQSAFSTGECYGAKCFRYSYMITTLFFSVNFVLSIYLLKKNVRKANN